jgi:BASS family bile acid:Na+ symporter
VTSGALIGQSAGPFRVIQEFMLTRLAASLAAGLAWLGRYGTQGFALSIFLGLALPQFSAAARPVLPITIFCFTTSCSCGSISASRRAAAAPGQTDLHLPLVHRRAGLLIGGAILLAGRETLDPGILLGLAIMGSAPPIMSSPAIAILYGFEPSLLIASVIADHVISPLVAPIMVELLAGAAVPLDRWALMLRLVLFVGGGMALRPCCGAGSGSRAFGP